MSALMHYEPFELRPAPELRLVSPQLATCIERVPGDLRLSLRLEEYKTLARDGWSVTALLAPDSRSVVLLACNQNGGTE